MSSKKRKIEKENDVKDTDKDTDRIRQIYEKVKTESDAIIEPVKLESYNDSDPKHMYEYINTRIANHGSSCFSGGRLDRGWFGPDKELANLFRLVEEAMKAFDNMLAERTEQEEEANEIEESNSDRETETETETDNQNS